MEYLLTITFVIFLSYYWFVGRSVRRLQACIDNGKVNYDGVSIEIPESLSQDEKNKLKKERTIYLKATRLMPGVWKLHLRNSEY